MFKCTVVILSVILINTVAAQYHEKFLNNALQRKQLLKEVEQLKDIIPNIQFNPFQNLTCVDLVKYFEDLKLIKLSNSTISCLKNAL